MTACMYDDLLRFSRRFHLDQARNIAIVLHNIASGTAKITRVIRSQRSRSCDAGDLDGNYSRLDLKGGAVVRARLGQRDSYAPIETRLSQTSAPVDVVAGMLTLHNFRTIYVADLDAIESRGDHEESLCSLSAAFPDVTFWVDAGIAMRIRRDHGFCVTRGKISFSAARRSRAPKSSQR